MGNEPKVLIIIVTWNKKKHILNLLGSLGRICYPEEKLDILVIDNHSEDGTPESISKHYPDITLIVNPSNLGGSGGFNTGLKWAFDQPEGAYDYLWLLDNDILVHRNALIELVAILEQKKNAGIAGSTMMQMECPWRINEMGAFINHKTGEFLLKRNFEEIPAWEGRKIEELLTADIEETTAVLACDPLTDVEYVAAASLLVRADVARKAGLWMDFFIHYDDAEWCLRIAGMGHRIIVSARSFVWHLSVTGKVPTWIIYYDCRNALYAISAHDENKKNIRKMVRHVLRNGLFYAMIGRPDLGRLHIDAIDDFFSGVMGKKDIDLPFSSYHQNSKLDSVFNDPSIHRILISHKVDFKTITYLSSIRMAASERDGLKIDFLVPAEGKHEKPAPGLFPVHLPGNTIARWVKCLSLIKKYDLIVQSDYKPVIVLTLLATEMIFVNNESFRYCHPPKIYEILKFCAVMVKRWRIKKKRLSGK